MKNPAFIEGFNSFTQYIKDRSDNGLHTLVQMRNGDIVLVHYEYGTGIDKGYNQFTGKISGITRHWEDDGKSITSSDFDLISIVEM